MASAISKFRDALDNILAACDIMRTFNLDLAPEFAGDKDFIREFESGTRVARLEIENPDGQRIPEDFVYYNPQRDRNEIIRESHSHDYPFLRKINLEATENGDIKQTHLRDLIYAGSPILMKYVIEGQEYTLRRTRKNKFELYINMESESVSEDQLRGVIELLREEGAFIIDSPTELPRPTAGKPENQSKQLSLFSDQNSGEEDDE